MEVSDHKVSIVVLEVRRRNGEHQTRKAADGEEHQETDRKQHRGFKTQSAAPHGADPVEHFHAGRHSDQHSGIHEEQLTGDRHTHSVHVVRPNDER